MFDLDLIEELPASLRVDLQSAFQLIATCGIIESQIQRHAARLEAGGFNESDEDVLTKLREFRQSRAALLALKQMGES